MTDRPIPPRPGSHPDADRTHFLGTSPDDATQIASDVPGQPTLPATRGRDELVAPIVVRNTLWNAADPLAYPVDQAADNTHLREFAQSGAGRRDDARWSGALAVIPAQADNILDLIRMNSLWPLLSGLACCAIEMMSAATSKNDMDRWLARNGNMPGCPPRPEGLMFGMMKLQQLIKDRRGHWAERPIGPTVPADV